MLLYILLYIAIGILWNGIVSGILTKRGEHVDTGEGCVKVFAWTLLALTWPIGILYTIGVKIGKLVTRVPPPPMDP